MSDQASTSDPKMLLRPYQRDALRAMAEAFVKKATVKRGLVVLPTGSGKTFVMSYFNSEVHKQLGLRIIWVAHRDELIKQAKEAHMLINPELKISEWMSDNKDPSGDLILTSIMSSRGLAETLEVLNGQGCEKFILVIDEAHHFAESDEKGYSNMYGKLETNLWSSKLIKFSVGLTATATRLDGRPLGYDEIIYQMPFMEGVRAQFLARPCYYEMRTRQEYHLDEVMKASGKRDYTDQDLQKLDNELRNKKIAELYVRNMEFLHDKDGIPVLDKEGNKVKGWGKTLIFAVNVPHCYHLAEEIKKLKPDAEVKVITGATETKEREGFAAWLAEGDMHTPKVAINCLVFTEGFDEPTINTLFLTRPTKSESLWMQMVGRGARIVKNPDGTLLKDKFNLICIMDEIGRFGALVKEWTLGLMDPELEETRQASAFHKKRIRAKRKLVTKFVEDCDIKLPDMDDAQLIDIQGILIVATKVTAPLGIPMDRDRLDCIRLLKSFVEQCYQQVEQRDGSIREDIDLEAFRNSYSHCVQANEFDHGTWKEIAWAYFFNYVRGQRFIRNTYTGKMEPTWRLVPMVDKEEIDGGEAVKAAEQRIEDVKDTANKKNEEFNLQWSGRDQSKRLYLHILDNITKRGGPDAAAFVSKHVVRVTAKDRRVEVKLNYEVTGNKDENLKNIGMANKIGTEILQQYLQDSVCEFRVSPTARAG